MDLKLTGRTALVTGSSKGIGLAVAQWFAREGVNVCLVARSGERLEKEGAAIAKETGVTVRTLAADLADAAARERVFQTFPDVDILVNNAGAIPGGSLDDVDEAAWRAGWDLKVYGYVGLTRLYLRMMRERKRGVIINIIGLGGERLDATYIAGAMGNAGLMAFTRAIGGTKHRVRRARRRRQSGSGIDRPRRSLRPQARRDAVRRREPLAGELCQNALRPAGVNRRDRRDGGVSRVRSVVLHERHHRHDRRRHRQQRWHAVAARQRLIRGRRISDRGRAGSSRE